MAERNNGHRFGTLKMSNELTPDVLPRSLFTDDERNEPVNAAYWKRACRKLLESWKSDRDELAAAKARIGELEASVKYALTHTLVHKSKEADAPASADMHLSQAIERLNSAIEYAPENAERAEHLKYAIELVDMTRPKK